MIFIISLKFLVKLKSCHQASNLTYNVCTESIENMKLHMPNAKEISPTLRLIIEQFDEENQRPPSEAVSSLDQGPVFTVETIDVDDTNTDVGSGVSADGFAECGPSWDYDNENDNFNYDDDRESGVDGNTFPSNTDSTCYQEVFCLCYFPFFCVV
jgi:condensin complex subunit 2